MTKVGLAGPEKDDDAVRLGIATLAHVSRMPPSRLMASFSTIVLRAYLMLLIGATAFTQGLAWSNTVVAISRGGNSKNEDNVAVGWAGALFFSGIAVGVAYAATLLHCKRVRERAREFSERHRKGRVDLTKVTALPAAVWLTAVDECVDSVLFVAAVMISQALGATLIKGGPEMACALSWVYLIVLYPLCVAVTWLFNERVTRITARVFSTTSTAVIVQKEANQQMLEHIMGAMTYLVAFGWILAVDSTIFVAIHKDVSKESGRDDGLWVAALFMAIVTTAYLVASHHLRKPSENSSALVTVVHTAFLEKFQLFTKRGLSYATVLSVVWAIEASLPPLEEDHPATAYVVYFLLVLLVSGLLIPIIELTLYKREASVAAQDAPATDVAATPRRLLKTRMYLFEWYAEMARIIKKAMALLVAFSWSALVKRIAGGDHDSILFNFIYAVIMTLVSVMFPLAFARAFPEASEEEKQSVAVQHDLDPTAVKEVQETVEKNVENRLTLPLL